ncbi:MAG: AbiV family abortive infection protein [Terriglobia bacterium]|jgi:AbiV family abortive infection protein
MRTFAELSLGRSDFLTIYSSAHRNACQLLSEAEILFEHRGFARAFALAFTALEEISKSQLAADVFTGFIEVSDFQALFRHHKEKIARMDWVYEDEPTCYWDFDELVRIRGKPSFADRNDALYVDVDGKRVRRPEDVIQEEQAKSMISAVRLALERIWVTTEFWGHQIGTKGLLK